MIKPLLGMLLLTGISISFSSEDPHARMSPRHDLRDARLAITNRAGTVSLLLLKDDVAVQLTDGALAKVDTKDDASFVEELVAAGVRVALRKAVDYPIANIRSAEIVNGALTLTSDSGKPVFQEVKVNGTDVLRDFTPADAARFVSALRAAKRR
jgi:hypothetical protein